MFGSPQVPAFNDSAGNPLEMPSDSDGERGKYYRFGLGCAGFCKIFFAAIFAKPKTIPELLRTASGQSVAAARCKNSKSSVFIFTLTWTVRLPVCCISTCIYGMSLFRNDTDSTIRTTALDL